MTTTVGDDHLYSAGISRQRKRGVAGFFRQVHQRLQMGQGGPGSGPMASCESEGMTQGISKGRVATLGEHSFRREEECHLTGR